jgi:hypothetical protein
LFSASSAGTLLSRFMLFKSSASSGTSSASGGTASLRLLFFCAWRAPAVASATKTTTSALSTADSAEEFMREPSSVLGL